MLRFTLSGKIKPYVRMTQRGKHVRVRNGKLTQAAEYLDSKAALQWQFKEQMRGREPFGKVPLCCTIIFYGESGSHRNDLDNMIKAVLDAMNGIVYADDRYIDVIYAQRGNDKCAFSAIVYISEEGTEFYNQMMNSRYFVFDF